MEICFSHSTACYFPYWKSCIVCPRASDIWQNPMSFNSKELLVLEHMTASLWDVSSPPQDSLFPPWPVFGYQVWTRRFSLRELALVLKARFFFLSFSSSAAQSCILCLITEVLHWYQFIALVLCKQVAGAIIKFCFLQNIEPSCVFLPRGHIYIDLQ